MITTTVELPDPKNLVFEESHNAPVFTCCFCGKESEGQRIASFNPFLDAPDISMSVTVCSEDCEMNYKSHPKAKNHMMDFIETAFKMEGFDSVKFV